MEKKSVYSEIARALNSNSIFNIEYINASNKQSSFWIGSIKRSSKYDPNKYFEAIVLNDNFQPAEYSFRTFRIDRIENISHLSESLCA